MKKKVFRDVAREHNRPPSRSVEYTGHRQGLTSADAS